MTSTRYGLPSAAARHNAYAQLAVHHDDTPTLTGELIPPAPAPVPPHIADIIAGLRMHVRGWEADPRQTNLLHKYLEAGRKAPERTNPCGNLPYFRQFQAVVKSASFALTGRG